jgi:hypothetical protein
MMILTMTLMRTCIRILRRKDKLLLNHKLILTPMKEPMRELMKKQKKNPKKEQIPRKALKRALKKVQRMIKMARKKVEIHMTGEIGLQKKLRIQQV